MENDRIEEITEELKSDERFLYGTRNYADLSDQ